MLARAGGQGGADSTHTSASGFNGGQFTVSGREGTLNSAVFVKSDKTPTARIGNNYKDDVESFPTCGANEVITGAELAVCNDKLAAGSKIKCGNPFPKYCSANLNSGVCRDLKTKDLASWKAGAATYCVQHAPEDVCEELRTLDSASWLQAARRYCTFDRMDQKVCRTAATADAEWHDATMVAACQQAGKWRDAKCKAFCASSPD